MKYYARVKTYVDGKNGFSHDCPYLTADKWYEIYDREVGSFCVTDDNGDELVCPDNGCDHLGGGDWEILSEDEINAMVDELWESVE